MSTSTSKKTRKMDLSYLKVFTNLKHLPLSEKGSAYYSKSLSMGLLPEVQRVSCKSVVKAVEYWNLGNECFYRKDFGGALECYTKSVSVAPPASAELAFAFANRSAALFKLKKFRACIVDVNRALMENYPENMKPKLYDRKNRCVSLLRNPERNAPDLSEMLFHDSYQASGDREDLEGFDLNSRDLNYDDMFCPPELDSKNEAIPYASEKVAIKYSSTFGRHIVAVNDIKPGECIAVEKPISSILYWSFQYSHCANCFMRCESLIPCPICTQVLFCSKRCLNDAFDGYHRIECQILLLNGYPVLEKLEWRVIRLLIMVTKQGKELESLMAHPAYMYPFIRAPEKIPDILDSQDYGNIHNLEDHHEKKSERGIWMMVHAAAHIIHVLKHTTFFEEQQDAKKSLGEKIKYLGALLTKFLLLCPNTCDVSEWLNGKKMVMIGAAFFSFHSFINHSCDENVFRTFHKDTVVTTTIRSIKAGEQIVENYGMWYESDNLATRQKFLLEHYYFKCRCVACENDWPNLMNFPSAKAVIGKSKELKQYAEAVERGNYSFNTLCEYVALLQEKAARPNMEFHECQQELSRRLIYQGNSYFVGIQEFYSVPYPKDNVIII